jgi:RHS repeat-associated protein
VKQGGTVIATYTYDALDRRIGVQEGGSTTWTVFNGTSPDAMPYADFNGSGGALLTRYLHGPGVVNGAVVDALLARTTSGGATAWYLPDKLGSVRDIVDSSGSVQDHVVYDSFGKVVTETAVSNGDRFKFADMQFDAVTGQYFDHARWYGTASGRFSAKDQLGFGAGDGNLYRYVANAPLDHSDPTGELQEPGDVPSPFPDKPIPAPVNPSALIKDAINAMREALEAEFKRQQKINMNVPPPQRMESGGFLLYNPTTKNFKIAHTGVNVGGLVKPLSTRFMANGPNIYDPLFLPGRMTTGLFAGYVGDNPLEDLSGYVIFATYHFHPNTNFPSKADSGDVLKIKTGENNAPAAGLIISPDGEFTIYGPGVPGNVLILTGIPPLKRG